MASIKRKPRPPTERVKEDRGPHFAWGRHPFDPTDRPPRWQRIGPYIVPRYEDDR